MRPSWVTDTLGAVDAPLPPQASTRSAKAASTHKCSFCHRSSSGDARILTRCAHSPVYASTMSGTGCTLGGTLMAPSLHQCFTVLSARSGQPISAPFGGSSCCARRVGPARLSRLDRIDDASSLQQWLGRVSVGALGAKSSLRTPEAARKPSESRRLRTRRLRQGRDDLAAVDSSVCSSSPFIR